MTEKLTRADPRPRRPDSVGRHERALPRSVAYAIVGLAPISSLALSILEVIPLHLGGPVLVGGAVALALGLAIGRSGDRRAIGRGLGAGLLAVLVYDCTRLPLVVLGDWPDFIPKIGAWLTDEPGTHWSLGYLWRYLGNGAGMGLTFTMLFPHLDQRLRRRWAGVVYGIGIWSGLIAVVLIAPDGQAKLFPLGPTTLAASLIGHLVYGGVLGTVVARWWASGRPALADEAGCLPVD